MCPSKKRSIEINIIFVDQVRQEWDQVREGRERRGIRSEREKGGERGLSGIGGMEVRGEGVRGTKVSGQTMG